MDDQLELLDVCLVEKLGHHEHLGELGIHVDPVALIGYELNLALALAEHLHQALYVVYIFNFHLPLPPVIPSVGSTPRCRQFSQEPAAFLRRLMHKS